MVDEAIRFVYGKSKQKVDSSSSNSNSEGDKKQEEPAELTSAVITNQIF